MPQVGFYPMITAFERLKLLQYEPWTVSSLCLSMRLVLFISVHYLFELYMVR
jgi:hypothetical protein